MNAAGDPSRTSQGLDLDVLPWEQQPGESDEAYAGFLLYRDAERRAVRNVPGGNGSRWSMRWSWSMRCLEWDRHVQREDDEMLVRYRLEMNDRQRRAARLAQQKVVQWLLDTDPGRWTPHEAARWLEVSARLEREAAGAGTGEPQALPPPQPPDPFEGMTLGEILGLPGEDAYATAERLWLEMEGRDQDSRPPAD